MTVECACEEWKSYNKVMKEWAVLLQTYGDNIYWNKVKIFKYCPYCSKKLKEI